MAQRTKLLKMNKQEKVDFGFCMVILIPIMLLFAIIRFIPIIETFVVSFFQKSMIRPGQKFNGIENYIYVLTDPEFLKALQNTFLITVFAMTLSVLGGLFLASVVNSGRRGMKFWQAILFIPVIVSLVPSTLMWKMLFDYNIGVVNQILNVFGVASINWINNGNLVVVPIIVVSVWKEMGYNMMIFYVGLKAISRELYESAALDGVNHWQRLRYITLPQLKPVTLFICVMAMIKFVKVFTQAITMTSGSQSSGNIFKTLVYYIYQQGFSLHSMGRASAMILLLIVFVLTAIQMRLDKED